MSLPDALGRALECVTLENVTKFRDLSGFPAHSVAASASGRNVRAAHDCITLEHAAGAPSADLHNLAIPTWPGKAARSARQW